MGGTREPHGSFLALQPAQAGFKPLEITVAHALVTALGWLLVSTAWPVRKRSFSSMLATERVMSAGFIGNDRAPTGILARASWRANRRKRPRVTGGKFGC